MSFFWISVFCRSCSEVFTNILHIADQKFTTGIYTVANKISRRKIMYKKFRFALSVFLTVAVVISIVTGSFAINKDEAKQANPNIKNIIVMIPDGMSVDGLALARWYKAYDAETGTFDGHSRG